MPVAVTIGEFDNNINDFRLINDINDETLIFTLLGWNDDFIICGYVTKVLISLRNPNWNIPLLNYNLSLILYFQYHDRHEYNMLQRMLMLQ